MCIFFFFQAEDGIRDYKVTGVQTCALPISVDAGMRLFRIGAIDDVWIDADVYEADLARVKVGDPATVTLDFASGHAIVAKVGFVSPSLDAATRAGRVRIVVKNADGALKPGMFATVDLGKTEGTKLQVPSSAVVYTGPRRIVFVDVGDGRFRPTEIHVGAESDGMLEV